MAERVDSLFRGASELVPLTDGPEAGAVRGPELAKAGSLEDASIAVRSGKVVAVGPGSEIEASFHAETEVDLSGYVVVPGFVDCHTHPVFAETREEEFTLRCQGADYVEIARTGGGILSSVRALRAADEEELVLQIAERLRRFLALGTTTIEAKSGYGLSTQSELKSLRALGRAREESPLTMSTTFLGAHEVAPEYREDPEAYVELLVSEMLPEARPLADSCDAFVEEHVFGLQQSAKILGAARELGYRLRVHVDEIVPLGGAEMAVGLGAASADHLVKVSDRGIHELAESTTTAVLLPGTSFFLRKKDHAPARRLVDAGAIVALATDYNPGSCYTQSMPMIATLARIHYGLTPAECLNAMTRNAAYSLALDGDRGTLHPGKAADFAVLDLPSFQAFGYAFGDNPVVMTVKDGVPVALNRTDFDPELGAQISGV